MTDRARQAEIVKNQVMKVKVKAEALVESIAKEKAIAEEKLEAARPALEEAESALNTIKPAHIATVRKLGRPPHLIMRIMDCVLILFKRKLHPVISDTTVRCPKPSWPESLKVNILHKTLLNVHVSIKIFWEKNIMLNYENEKPF